MISTLIRRHSPNTSLPTLLQWTTSSRRFPSLSTSSRLHSSSIPSKLPTRCCITQRCRWLSSTSDPTHVSSSTCSSRTRFTSFTRWNASSSSLLRRIIIIIIIIRASGVRTRRKDNFGLCREYRARHQRSDYRRSPQCELLRYTLNQADRPGMWASARIEACQRSQRKATSLRLCPLRKSGSGHEMHPMSERGGIARYVAGRDTGSQITKGAGREGRRQNSGVLGGV